MQTVSGERRVETAAEQNAKVAAALAERREELRNAEALLRREREAREEDNVERRAEAEAASARLEASERAGALGDFRRGGARRDRSGAARSRARVGRGVGVCLRGFRANRDAQS